MDYVLLVNSDNELQMSDGVINQDAGTDLGVTNRVNWFEYKARQMRLGGREAMWRVRAGAEGPRRTAAGASKATRRAGTRDGAPLEAHLGPGRPCLRRRLLGGLREDAAGHLDSREEDPSGRRMPPGEGVQKETR